MIFVVAENIVISTFHPLVENWPWCFIRTKQKLLELRSHSKFWGRPETLFLKHSENIDLVAYDYWLLAKYNYIYCYIFNEDQTIMVTWDNVDLLLWMDHKPMFTARLHIQHVPIMSWPFSSPTYHKKALSKYHNHCSIVALGDLLRNHSWSPQKVQWHFVYHFHEKSITFATCQHGSTSEMKN